MKFLTLTTVGVILALLLFLTLSSAYFVHKTRYDICRSSGHGNGHCILYVWLHD